MARVAVPSSPSSGSGPQRLLVQWLRSAAAPSPGSGLESRQCTGRLAPPARRSMAPERSKPEPSSSTAAHTSRTISPTYTHASDRGCQARRRERQYD
eukprot:145372-Prymnesium_polylepis.2